MVQVSVVAAISVLLWCGASLASLEQGMVPNGGKTHFSLAQDCMRSTDGVSRLLKQRVVARTTTTTLGYFLGSSHVKSPLMAQGLLVPPRKRHVSSL